MPKEDCQSVPKQVESQECRDVPREVCGEVAIPNCISVPKESCTSVPMEVEEKICQNIPRDDCQQVSYFSLNSSCVKIGTNIFLMNCFYSSCVRTVIQ